jgi:hypothetical protein
VIDKKGNRLDPAAVEVDKTRWLKAWQLLRQKSQPDIRVWLNDQPEDYREDMRRRLNTVALNRKRGYSG